MKPIVSIIMGSTSDLPIMEKAAKLLDELQVPFEMNARRILPSRGITRYANALLMKTAFSAMKSLTVGATVLRHAILESPHF